MWQERDIGEGKYTITTEIIKEKIYTVLRGVNDKIYLNDYEFEDLFSLHENLKIERRRAKEVIESGKSIALKETKC